MTVRTTASAMVPDTPPQGAYAPPEFQLIYLEYGPFVWRAMSYLGVPVSDVEDACQQVFLVVLRKLAEFEGNSAIKTWIYGICLRVASERRKRASASREAPSAEPPEEEVEPAQEAELERQQTRKRLTSALAQLDEDQREVFVLYEIEQLTMKEVARTVACPLFTAYSRLRLARAAMKRLLTAELTP